MLTVVITKLHGDRFCPKCKRVYYNSRKRYCAYHLKDKTQLVIMGKWNDVKHIIQNN